MVRGAIERLGSHSTNLVLQLGSIASFGGRTARAAVTPSFWLFPRLVREIYDTGVLSLAIILASGLTVGMVLGLQLYWLLTTFGSETALGGAVGATLVRELGPVLTGLLVTGRAGSAMAAEIAVMNASEQLDGMRTMAVDPVRFVVGPKALAMLICMPLLNALFICAAIGGTWLIAVQLLGLDSGVFFSNLEAQVDWETDVVGTNIKALVFGALVGLIATYRGFTSGRSAEQVSRATTSTVVTASVCILLADYIVTSIWKF
jgi:phospholipid/cholesterol/gamma-HCH transport system permease protein